MECMHSAPDCDLGMDPDLISSAAEYQSVKNVEAYAVKNQPCPILGNVPLSLCPSLT